MKPTTVNKWLLPLIVIMCIALGAGSAWAQGQGFGSVGPLNAIGYPSFIGDKQNLLLEPCLVSPVDPTAPVVDPCALAGTLPLGDDQPIVFVSNFPQEFFYSNVTTTIGKTGEAQPNGALDATIIMAVEGGFTAPLPPTIGQQVVFIRTRLRVDAGLQAGATYKATFPFGQITFVAETGGKLKQVTTDVGCLAAPCGTFQQLLTAVDSAGNPTNGPFLQAVDPAPPVGYIGDPNVFQTITGSPVFDAAGNPQNYFSIERVNGDGTLTLEGNALLFSVWGKLFTGPPQPPTLTIERTSYTKTAVATTVNVFSRSVGATSVTASVAGVTITLNPDPTSDRWFGQAVVPAAAAGNAVNITALNAALPADDPNRSLTLSSSLVDEVIIDGADYAAGALTVRAHSADFTKPALTAQAAENPPSPLGTLDFAGILIVNTTAPPAYVTVVSAKGGAATRAIDLGAAATSIVTATTLSSSKNPSNFGEAVTFTANVTAAGGTLTGSVSFSDGGVTLAVVPLSPGGTPSSGFAAYTTSTLAMGSHTITAVFMPADTTFKPSASSIVIQVVNKGASTTTLALSPSTVARKASVNATATVSSLAGPANSGTVTFTIVVNNSTITLGTAPVDGNGIASVTFAAPNNRGTFTVRASYGGNASLNTSSGTATLIIQ